ncbi:MAG: hypothetical protein KF810_00925 [Rhizobiaceae bacterium]|nr:hypothetical protein [Rhizobiaceae bacterium]
MYGGSKRRFYRTSVPTLIAVTADSLSRFSSVGLLYVFFTGSHSPQISPVPKKAQNLIPANRNIAHQPAFGPSPPGALPPPAATSDSFSRLANVGLMYVFFMCTLKDYLAPKRCPSQKGTKCIQLSHRHPMAHKSYLL